jgi:hypothetical protein
MSKLRFRLSIVAALTHGGAGAQSIDCQTLLNTSIPYELQLNQEHQTTAKPPTNIPLVQQTYRNAGNLSMVYTKQSNWLLRTLAYGPLPTEFTLGPRVFSKMEYVGIDVRSPPPLETNYTYTHIITSERRGREQFEVARSYQGNKTTKLGGCDLKVISARSESKVDGKTRRILDTEYSPELRAILYSRYFEPDLGIVVTTTATEIRVDFAPFEEKWDPVTPSRAP